MRIATFTKPTSEEIQPKSKLAQFKQQYKQFPKLGVLASKASESETVRRFAKAAFEGYDMDEESKRKVREASKMLQRRVEDQTLSMKNEEFIKSLKGGSAFAKSLNAQFRKELERLGVTE
jgi:hypothetical protein